MSDEQQLAAIGRTVEEYAACKKKLEHYVLEMKRKQQLRTALVNMRH